MDSIKKLPNSDLVYSLYRKYYGSFKEFSGLVSSHWESFIPRIKVDIDDEGNIRQFLGYGFGDLQQNRLFNRLPNYICNFSYFLTLANKRDLIYLCRLAIKNSKLMGSYLSYDSFRQVVAFSQIREYFKLDEGAVFDVLVIGDGYGFLSALIKMVYPKCRIVLADIGDVLLFQSINLQKIFPGYSHYSVADDHGQADFVYCPTENLYNMKLCSYKLIINIASMQEMNYFTISRYFDYIRKYAAKDNFFYCCNRIYKRLPGGEEIEFFKYPWNSRDIHYIDEEPKFYRYFISSRYPFIRYFDGKMQHRLTSMEVISK
jgi:hypothetical protein